MYRHGDLLIIGTKKIPDNSIIQKDGIIAKGEITGHHHRIADGTKAVLLISAGIAYIKALQESEIVHEEHNTIILPAGNYKVIRQREYKPSGWRQVLD